MGRPPLLVKWSLSTINYMSTATSPRSTRAADPLAEAHALSAEIPKGLRKSTLWCLSQLDAAMRAAVKATLGRTSASGVNLRGYWALEAIASKGALAQSDLSTILSIDRSDMVRLVDALESDGLVSRTRDAKDRRRQLVSLTKEGKELRSSLHRSVRRAERTVLRDFPLELHEGLAPLLDGPLAADQPGVSADAATASMKKKGKKKKDKG